VPDSAATRALASRPARERLVIYLERLAECEMMLERTKDHQDRQALIYTAERWRQLIEGAKRELGIR
jgi:hypothetical protein